MRGVSAGVGFTIFGKVYKLSLQQIECGISIISEDASKNLANVYRFGILHRCSMYIYISIIIYIYIRCLNVYTTKNKGI